MPPAQGLESQKRVGLRYSRSPRQADLRHPGWIPAWKAPLYSWPPSNRPAPWGRGEHLSCLGRGRAGRAPHLTSPEGLLQNVSPWPGQECLCQRARRGRVVMGTGCEEIPVQEGHS